MAEIERRVARVQWHARPIAWIEEASAQRALKQVKAHQGREIGHDRALAPRKRPIRLDLTDSLDNQFVIGTVWATMEWQPGAQRRVFGPGQQLAVAAEVVNPDSFVAKRIDHSPEGRKA